MRLASFVVASLSATALAHPMEFHLMTQLPPGYTPNAAVWSRINSGTVTQGTPGVLTGVSTNDAKPFLVSFGGAPGMPLADTEFAVQPQGGQCAGHPPYWPGKPQIGSHAVCVKFPNTGFMWKCPWEWSYSLTSRRFAPRGCADVTVDCGDVNRIARVLAKYDWIQPRTDDYGPEMHAASLNTYAKACVVHQCHGGPDPGLAPPTPARLYNSEMSQEAATGNTAYMLGFLVASVFVVAGLVFVVVRVGKARAADRGVDAAADEEMELSALMALKEDQ